MRREKRSSWDYNIDPNKGNPLNPIDDPFINPFEKPLRDILYNINNKPGHNKYNQKPVFYHSQELYAQAFDYGLDRGRWKRAYARVIHLSPDTPPIDIYLDGKLFYNGVSYKMKSEYTLVRPGNHRIIFYPAGQTRNPVFYKTIFVPRKSIVSLIVYGLSTNIDVMVVDDRTCIVPGRVRVKFVHLSPKTPALDLLVGRSVVFNHVFFQESTEYISAPSGHESLSLRISGTRHIIMTIPNTFFSRNRAYTIYAIGLLKTAPKIQMMVTIDGSGRFKLD